MLCYHAFDSKKISPFTVSSADFERQMRFLHTQHFPVIPLSQLIAFLEGKSSVPDHAVVITLDDGYRSGKTRAWPILRRYDFPFTVFVYPHFLDGHPAAMTWADLRAMAQSRLPNGQPAVEIESHSLSHPLLTHPGVAMNRADYVAWVDRELQESKREIEAHLHQPVTSIAYPYGGYSEFIVERTRKAGYAAALTCEDANVTSYTDPFRINRRLVFRQTSIKTFVSYFMDRPLVVTDLAPRDGERVVHYPHEIHARIQNIAQILPDSAKILISKVERHWVPVRVDGATGQFRFPLPKSVQGNGSPGTKYYFVSLSARDRATPSIKREASWLFMIKQNGTKN